MTLYHGTQKEFVNSLIVGIDVNKTTNLIESGGRPCFYTSTNPVAALEWATQGCEELNEYAAEPENFNQETTINTVAARYAIVVITLDGTYSADGVTTESKGNTVMIFGENSKINLHTQRTVLSTFGVRDAVQKMINGFGQS